MTIHYDCERIVTVEQAINLYRNCSLGKRRPLDDPKQFSQMLRHANLIVTAWDDERLVGMARAFSDFVHVTYLADLVVDEDYQKMGIGKRLIKQLKQQCEESCRIVLLAAPTAKTYYARLGFAFDARAWVLEGHQALR